MEYLQAEFLLLAMVKKDRLTQDLILWHGQKIEDRLQLKQINKI